MAYSLDRGQNGFLIADRGRTKADFHPKAVAYDALQHLLLNLSHQLHPNLG